MIDPFRKIGNEEKAKLLKHLETDTLTIPKGEVVSDVMPYQNYIGIVLDGTLQIVSTDFEGNRTIVEELTKNEVFGSKLSLLTNQETTLIAIEDSSFIVIDYFSLTNNVHNTSPSYQQFTYNLIEIMISMMNDRNERILILSKKTIRNRLLKYFEIMRKKSGMRYFHIPFTYTDLADYLGVDRSAMTREIKSLKEEGIIEVKNRRITLLN